MSRYLSTRRASCLLNYLSKYVLTREEKYRDGKDQLTIVALPAAAAAAAK